MKKWLISISIFFVILFAQSDVFSRGLRIGAKGGIGIHAVNVAQPGTGYYDEFTNEIIGFTYGGVLELLLVDLRGIGVGVEVDVLIQRRGGEYFDGEEKINYLGFPVIGKLYIADLFFVGLGLSYQMKLDSSHPLGSNVKKENLEFLGTVGLNYQFMPRVYFTAEARFSAGLMNYSTDPADSLYTRSTEILLGVMLKLF